MPPVLGIGSCVDNSRILIAASEMVKTGGLGNCIADLPVAGAAPEYMSEKAICIGQYFVASGVFTVFGVTFPIVEGTKFHKHLFEDLEKMGMGKWGFATDPHEMARMIIEHIDKKRKALGIDKARERQLMSMADRRSLTLRRKPDEVWIFTKRGALRGAPFCFNAVRFPVFAISAIRGGAPHDVTGGVEEKNGPH